MTGNLALLVWSVTVVAGIAAMQWGASRASAGLSAYSGRVGLGGVVGGALLGIATAAPEISVNVTSVALGWPDLGLGAALGSNVPALPLVFLISWLAVRSASGFRLSAAPNSSRASIRGSPGDQSVPTVGAAAVEIQAVPYLLVVLLLALLTLPPPWAGLQPIDGVLLLAAWGAYLARALSQRRERPRPDASQVPIGRALVGVPAIALGALASVVSARHLADAFGASDLVAGLFVIGLLCAMPESFAAWSLARQNKTTTAVSTAMADGIVSLTIALVPPALAGAEVGDVPLYFANLAFLVIVLLAYIGLDHFRRGQELGLARVALFSGGYLVYLGIVAYLLGSQR